MENQSSQLISYIAPASPATRKPSIGKELFTHLEIAFTPKLYQHSLNINFDEKWHTDPASCRGTIISMHEELRRRFLNIKIGRIDEPDKPLNLLTGTYGSTNTAAIYAEDYGFCDIVAYDEISKTRE